MNGRVERKNEHLPGVKCVVDTCQYHAQGDYCNAAKIEIQPGCKGCRDRLRNLHSQKRNDLGYMEKAKWAG